MPRSVPRTNDTPVVFEPMLLRHDREAPALFCESDGVIFVVATQGILARTKVSEFWQLGRRVIVVHG